eukprot:TRINITY_DN35906_c0_g1_i1.p1 TRINITY_DN35906_c0_g1~~TRINITY_DN35906_c0_g1_i1.p1  ORF type:complete len:168 (+),score=51.70 TRINITY_DN35906_c0_g1_i1:56-559(+)
MFLSLCLLVFVIVVMFFFSSRRRHTRCREVSWARRCVQETGINAEYMGIMETGRECGARKEAAWILVKVSNSPSEYQVKKLVEENIILAFSNILQMTDPYLLSDALSSLWHLLSCGENSGKENIIADQFEAVGGIDILGQLEKHQYLEIQKKSFRGALQIFQQIIFK